MTDQPTERRPDRDWLADIIGAAVRRHESWQDCTCSYPDMGECWYHLTDAQQDHWTGDAALRELEAHDLTIIRDEDLGAVSVVESDRRRDAAVQAERDRCLAWVAAAPLSVHGGYLPTPTETKKWVAAGIESGEPA